MHAGVARVKNIKGVQSTVCRIILIDSIPKRRPATTRLMKRVLEKMAVSVAQ